MIYIREYEPIDRKTDRLQEHRIGRQLLDYGLRQEYGISADVRQERGRKPYLGNLPQISFNISHTRGLVVCAIGFAAVGVDVEYIRDYDVRLMNRICSEEEMDYINADKKESEERFFRIWTLKESYLKNTGVGLERPMREIQFRVEQREGAGKITASIPGFVWRQFRFQNKYIISICEEELL